MTYQFSHSNSILCAYVARLIVIVFPYILQSGEKDGV